MALNLWSDVSSISNSIRDDAVFVVREAGKMQNLITVFRDAAGGNPRIGYAYNKGTAQAIAETDDLTSKAFTPSADQTLTPAEIGLQFFVTDLRAESEAPENIITDAARELGLAANDKIESDLVGDLASLTGGTLSLSGILGRSPFALSGMLSTFQYTPTTMQFVVNSLSTNTLGWLTPVTLQLGGNNLNFDFNNTFRFGPSTGNFSITSDTYAPGTIPEPSTIGLVGLGLLLVARRGWGR